MKSKRVFLMPFLESLSEVRSPSAKVRSPSHPKEKTAPNPEEEKTKGKGAKANQNPLN